MDLRRDVLWVDCTAAFVTGALMFGLGPWLAERYGLPTALILGHALVHVSYGTFSCSLAVRATRPLSLIVALVCANALWAAVCVVVAFIAEAGHVLWRAHLLLEGTFVAGLAFVEWSQRHDLRARRASAQ